MKPLKFSALISETAKRTGQPMDITDALLRLYFKELRIALTSLSFPSVQVLNLGTFNLKLRTVEKKLSRKQALLERLSDAPARCFLMREEVEQDIIQMAAALKIMDNEKARRNSIRKSRKTNHEQGH